MFRSTAALLAALGAASVLLVAPANSRAIDAVSGRGHVSADALAIGFSRRLLDSQGEATLKFRITAFDTRHNTAIPRPVDMAILTLQRYSCRLRLFSRAL